MGLIKNTNRDNFQMDADEGDIDFDLDQSQSGGTNGWDENYIDDSENNDLWGSSGGVRSDSPAEGVSDTDSGIDVWGDTSVSQGESTEGNSDKKVIHLGYKRVGIILACFFVFLAFIFTSLSNINEKNKSSQSVGNHNTDQREQSTQKTDNNILLIEIPSSTKLDYTGDIYETNGTVQSKLKYLQDHQVLYCILIKVVVGSSSEEIRYYCNHASFNRVSVGDLLIVKYQQPQDGYISVVEVAK